MPVLPLITYGDRQNKPQSDQEWGAIKLKKAIVDYAQNHRQYKDEGDMLEWFRKDAEEKRRMQRFGRALAQQASVEEERRAMLVKEKIKTEPTP